MQRVQEAHYLHSLSDLAVENSEPESALHSAPGGGMLTIADASYRIWGSWLSAVMS